MANVVSPLRTVAICAKLAVMHQIGTDEPPRRGLRLAGWALLLLALPLAVLGSFTPANEYKSWGLDALDCDGPSGIYLVAVPALLVYGAGLAINGLRWRKPVNRVVALLCLLVCTLLVVNIVRAAQEGQAQQADCLARG